MNTSSGLSTAPQDHFASAEPASAALRPELREATAADRAGMPNSARVHDAATLQRLLQQEFATEIPAPPKVEVAPDAVAPTPIATPVAKPISLAAHPWASRLVKSAVGLALLIAVGIMPAQRLLQVASVEALVNARLVMIRAPIDGVVTANGAAAQPGAQIAAGSPLATVVNQRVDDRRLVEAQDRLEDLRAEKQAKWATLLHLLDARTNLEAQLAAFREGRIRSASAHVDAAKAAVDAATADQTRTAADLERKTKLLKKGAVTKAVADAATRDAEVATAAVRQAEAEQTVRQVELDALQRGVFFGDDYNDEPRTAQRIDEIDVQAAAMEADITRLSGAIERAGVSVERERASAELLAKAQIVAPAKAQIWQVLTAPGEQVVAGQELYSLLDCSQAIVTAVVSEATYNTLNVGMPARFTFRDSGEPLSGRIVHLSGVAEASSNYAIAPSSLIGDSYRVSVAIDGGGEMACQIGRTGRVVFGAKS